MKVEFEVEFPENLPENLKKEITTSKFVIEMAPIDKMPHATNVFLLQILHKLWDGCHFVINAAHVLKAGPYHHIIDETTKLQGKFLESGFSKLAFQEYHPDFPHEKYTVAFHGRPAGPDIYINLKNNTIFHGPYGQRHQDLEEEADTCFAKVIKGDDVIKAIRMTPTSEEGIMEKFVHIKHARILTPENEPLDYENLDEYRKSHQLEGIKYIENYLEGKQYNVEKYTYHAKDLIMHGTKRDNIGEIKEEMRNSDPPEKV